MTDHKNDSHDNYSNDNVNNKNCLVLLLARRAGGLLLLCHTPYVLGCTTIRIKIAIIYILKNNN
jgi:hypothetical protein